MKGLVSAPDASPVLMEAVSLRPRRRERLSEWCECHQRRNGLAGGAEIVPEEVYGRSLTPREVIRGAPFLLETRLTEGRDWEEGRAPSGMGTAGDVVRAPPIPGHGPHAPRPLQPHASSSSRAADSEGVPDVWERPVCYDEVILPPTMCQACSVTPRWSCNPSK
ncbi:hypothetical protein E2C01_003371 [Portunus trituberculatus]|uniref:Uncharacterized protein n=1 Tax=Portunus trituberculatus TaxID=210409 RepID=A0A5B7CMM7_PORTR|nr:hypothetical protein [Portunus trituberculatus]